jgi:uncharacterized protein involved in exopolysaccharide biosynthesis
LLPFLAVLAAATAFTLQQANRYCSTAQVLIADSEAQVAIQGDANVSVASRDLANEINVAYSDSVTDQVAARLGFSPEVEVDGEADSDILLFRACGPTADDSAQYANTWADVYVTTKQQQAADSIGTAVGGFEVRLTELRERRQEIRQPLDELEDRLARASGDQLKASLQTQVDRMQLDLAVELQLLDAQIQTIASNVTLLQLDSELARTGTARVMQLAAPPLTPSNAPLSRNLILGGVIGLIGSSAAQSGARRSPPQSPGWPRPPSPPRSRRGPPPASLP